MGATTTYIRHERFGTKTQTPQQKTGTNHSKTICPNVDDSKTRFQQQRGQHGKAGMTTQGSRGMKTSKGMKTKHSRRPNDGQKGLPTRAAAFPDILHAFPAVLTVMVYGTPIELVSRHPEYGTVDGNTPTLTPRKHQQHQRDCHRDCPQQQQ